MFRSPCWLLVWVVSSFLSLIPCVHGEDWPQWRGPDRTDISTETGLLQDWPAGGPPRVWLYREAGQGYSGFAVVQGRLVTMGTRDGQAMVLALDANSGEELWCTPIGLKYENGWGDGPRATPTISDGYVYAMSGGGDLACLAFANGDKRWEVNMADFGGQIPKWGYSESVLVDGDQVVCTPGGDAGAIVALNAADGSLRWQAEELSDGAQYSSIIAINREGRREYIQLFMANLASVEATTGALIWQVPWTGRVAVCPTPIHFQNHVYVSSGYGVGCMLVQLPDEPGGEPSKVYANKVMKNHHGGVILLGEHLYGYSDSVGWTCQAAASGDEVWANKKDLEKGSIAYADGRFYCVGERDGEVVLINASPAGWEEHGRFTLDPQTEIRSSRGGIWTHPVIANGKLYLRDQDLIYCYNIR